MRKQKEMKLHLLRLGIVNALRIHADGLDDLWLFRHVVVHVAIHAGDVHSGLRILGDLTKRRILTVKVRRVGHHDENWLPALSGIIVRAIERTPSVCLRSFLKPLAENSPLIS